MEVTAAETGTQWAKLRGRLFTPKEKASVDLAESHEFPWAVMRRALQRPPVLLLLLVPVAMALNLYVLRPSKRSAMTRAVVAHGKPASAIARALHIADRPWGGAPPGWCKGLIAHPLERPRVNRVYPDCDRGRFGAVCKEDGRPRFFSQYNQDIWLFQNHFKHLKRRGVYVDIAANEPVAISNTYFFDVCLQWRGLCVEANKQYVDLLKQHRSCAITSACVGDTAGNATYYLGGGYSGVRGTNKNWAAHGKNLNETHLIDVQCVPTADALAAAGVNVIDLLSLDVEGHEYKVLRGIDWGQTRVNVIVIETLSLETQELLHDIGYKRGLQPVLNHELKKKGNLYRDYVYLHPDVVWGKPI